METLRTNTSHVRNEQMWDHRALASAALVTSAHACLCGPELPLPWGVAAAWL